MGVNESENSRLRARGVRADQTPRSWKSSSDLGKLVFAENPSAHTAYAGYGDDVAFSFSGFQERTSILYSLINSLRSRS